MVTRIAVTALLCGILVAPLAQSQEPPNDGKRCLPITGISSTRVVDNRHIIFKMRNGQSYMNELPHACPGMSKNDPIMYKTSQSQLCDLDIVTVLQMVGGGYMQGASCGLGRFVLMNELDGQAP